MTKAKAFRATPPLRSSAVALISSIPAARLPWEHTTQNARKGETT